MSNVKFPFRAVRDVSIGYARVSVARITYLGELGYEVYIPTEQAAHVYDCIVAEGEKEEVRMCMCILNSHVYTNEFCSALIIV